MLFKLKKLLHKWFLPKWLILAIDLVISGLSFFLTYLLRFNIFSQSANVPEIFFQMFTGLPFFILGAFLFKQHHNIIRHSSLYDIIVIFKSNLVLSIGFTFISFAGLKISNDFFIPTSVILVHFILSALLMILFRLVLVQVYERIIQANRKRKNVMIFGAGDMGTVAASLILKQKDGNTRLIGYIDDNPALWRNFVNRIQVYSPKMAFAEIISKHDVKELIIAISSDRLTVERKMEITDLCLRNKVKIRELYEATAWIEGKQIESKIRDVNIEDLLNRNVIDIPIESVYTGIKGKNVMVTGGAGSIGSEIVRQLIKLQPETIILVDQAESAVFEIQNEILPKLKITRLKTFISDVTNATKMRRIFELTRPDLIYHAAAYKHVPLMENQPYEAISNNIGGTKIIADLAVEYRVKKFVMVSSDKAVNPTNIMGATKRICEIYIQALSQNLDVQTEFITTRFGNVLGSNGSVIPIFKRQIQQGGPVTITHKDIIRYFMTIPEACRLVLEAGFLGNGGEIFIFDMGKPVKIYDLAIRMILLSGLIPLQDIQIIETGLRPGEKLYEELLNVKEETLPTGNQKIMIAKIRPYNYKTAIYRINQLLDQLNQMNNLEMVAEMKQIVPEFISQNSDYQKLDFSKKLKVS